MVDDNDKDDSSLFANMPFLDHLEELRWRLLKSALAIVVMAGAGFYFADDLIHLLRRPLGNVQLYNIAVTGTFYAFLKVALFAGIIGALPIIFYQMWSFISPGLYRREKAAILPLVAISTFLFALGATFCYFAVLPIAFKFLIGFGADQVTNTITIGSYISFVGLLEVAFGFCFQMPIIAYFLAKIGLVTPQMLSKGRRYAIVIMLVVSAIITPPDVFTQVLMAVPLYTLYEISIIVVRVVAAGKRRREREEEEDEAIESDSRDRLPYDPPE